MASQIDRSVTDPDGRRYSLAELLTENMTPEAVRDAFQWGEDVGRESVEAV